MQQQRLRRAGLTLALAFLMAVAFSTFAATRRSAATRTRLSSAERQLTELTERGRDGDRRAAIAWGYSEQLRLGLESPFRLIDAASRDQRLSAAERRTVSWALLSHVVRGESHEIDPAALDQLTPGVAGESHLAVISSAIDGSEDPRAAELALRLAYTLAAAEGRADGIAPLLVAEAAALVADREIARREARALVRAANERDPIEQIRRLRARRELYVERPVLLAPSAAVERDAIRLVPGLVAQIRALRGDAAQRRDTSATREIDPDVATRLFAAGARVPPAAPLAVTVQRYLPLLKGHSIADAERLIRAANPEMLIGALRGQPDGASRRNRARLLLAAAVSMRSMAQGSIWFDGDTLPASDVAARLGLARIDFDAEIPRSWRPYYLGSLTGAVKDLRRVLPSLRLDGVSVRFRGRSPADSALAMHDPRSRTLHLPVASAGGTLTHELAHDLDRQSAEQAGLAGYRSDVASRSTSAARASRLAASLRALTEELGENAGSRASARQRPAEVFATRVDWFVAQSLASEGVSNGFLSGVQDELLTGHVVHPDRLRGAGGTRTLVTALEGMTPIASEARADPQPGIEALLRWSLAAPVDRALAAKILAGGATSAFPCAGETDGRAALVRAAAESRAHGWIRQRARWMPDRERPAWARSALGQAPWDATAAEIRVAALRDHILLQLSTADELPVGIGASVAPLAAAARCGD